MNLSINTPAQSIQKKSNPSFQRLIIKKSAIKEICGFEYNRYASHISNVLDKINQPLSELAKDVDIIISYSPDKKAIDKLLITCRKKTTTFFEKVKNIIWTRESEGFIDSNFFLHKDFGNKILTKAQEVKSEFFKGAPSKNGQWLL